VPFSPGWSQTLDLVKSSRVLYPYATTAGLCRPTLTLEINDLEKIWNSFNVSAEMKLMMENSCSKVFGSINWIIIIFGSFQNE
jgi:hypothetical protein